MMTQPTEDIGVEICSMRWTRDLHPVVGYEPPEEPTGYLWAEVSLTLYERIEFAWERPTEGRVAPGATRQPPSLGRKPAIVDVASEADQVIARLERSPDAYIRLQEPILRRVQRGVWEVICLAVAPVLRPDI